MIPLSEKISQFPLCPGVYFMKDSNDNIIYVGKSKQLRNRVQSYFYKNKDHSKKVEKLVKAVKDIEYIITDTELEALILECKLIQDLKPIFNRKMKTPESYVYIKITKKNDLDTISISNVIKSNNQEATYYGPFMNRYRVEEALDALKNYFKINCLDFHKKSPCLNVSLGKCIGICTRDEHIMIQYELVLNEVKSFLNGTSTYVLDALEQQMFQAAQSLDFEGAAKIRENLDKVKILYHKEKVIELIRDQRKIILLEFLDHHFLKLFYLKGKDILYSKKYILSENITTIAKDFAHHIELEQVSNHIEKTYVNKHDIDEGQIVLSYLKQNENNCLFIDGFSQKITEPKQLEYHIANFLTEKLQLL